MFFFSDSELQPIEAQDLKSIVDSVKRDVDHHLKITSKFESASLPKSPEHDKSAVVDIDKFMKMIQDSIHHHLVRNLGQPSDSKNGESLVTENKFNGASVSDQLSEQTLKDDDSEVHEIRVGSTKGMPGVHFPDYTDIPRTSFVCSDKTILPGFYADLDTGCQVSYF